MLCVCRIARGPGPWVPLVVHSPHPTRPSLPPQSVPTGGPHPHLCRHRHGPMHTPPVSASAHPGVTRLPRVGHGPGCPPLPPPPTHSGAAGTRPPCSPLGSWLALNRSVQHEAPGLSHLASSSNGFSWGQGWGPEVEGHGMGGGSHAGGARTLKGVGSASPTEARKCKGRGSRGYWSEAPAPTLLPAQLPLGVWESSPLEL